MRPKKPRDRRYWPDRGQPPVDNVPYTNGYASRMRHRIDFDNWRNGHQLDGWVLKRTDQTELFMTTCPRCDGVIVLWRNRPDRAAHPTNPAVWTLYASQTTMATRCVLKGPAHDPLSQDR